MTLLLITLGVLYPAVALLGRVSGDGIAPLVIFTIMSAPAVLSFI